MRRGASIWLVSILLVTSGVAPILATQTAEATSENDVSGESVPQVGLGNTTAGNASENSSGSGGGLGGVLSWAGGVIHALSNPMATVQTWAEKLIEVLVSRPIPLRDGHAEYLRQPTNAPMDTVWEIWLTFVLPAALGIWALYMILIQFAGLLPPSLVTKSQLRSKRASGWAQLFHILGSWVITSLWLHICFGISRWFAPEGVVIFPGGESLLETAISGGVAGVILWLSSGVLAILIFLVFGLSYLAPFVLAPAYPLFVALSLPDFWIFRRFASIGEMFEGFFTASAAMTIPTSVILGLGYPVINRLREATDGPLASLGGVPLLSLLTLVMWFAALVTPLLLLMNARRMRPAAMFTAGLLGAASAVGMRNRASELRGAAGGAATGAAAGGAAGGTTGALAAASGGSSGGGSGSGGSTASVDPVSGSPFAADGGTTALGSGSTSSSTGAPAPATASGGGMMGQQHDSSGSMSVASGGHTPGSSSVAQSQDDIPGTQKYEIGYQTDDGFERIRRGEFDRDWLLSDGYSRIDSAFPDRDVVMRGAQSGATYAPRDVAGTGVRDAAESRRTVTETTSQ